MKTLGDLLKRAELTMDSRHFFGMKDGTENGSTPLRTLALVRESVARMDYLHDLGYTRAQIVDDISSALRMDCESMVPKDWV